jgi:hypothetical protein
MEMLNIFMVWWFSLRQVRCVASSALQRRRGHGLVVWQHQYVWQMAAGAV